jgi:hypothetical protein
VEGSTSLRRAAHDLLCLVEMDDEFIRSTTLPHGIESSQQLFSRLDLLSP